jgi:hypothetical protein
MKYPMTNQRQIGSRLLLQLFTASALGLMVLVPFLSDAQHAGNFVTEKDVDAEIIQRMTHDQAVYGMTTREGSVDLMLTGEKIVIQFTDRFLQELEDEIRGTAAEDPHLVAVVRSMVGSGVKTLLDRALAIPFHEIRDVYYESGRLCIIHRDGTEIFKDLDVDGHDVMEDFRRRDARRFVAQAERMLN